MAKKQSTTKKSRKKASELLVWPLYVALAIVFVLYIVNQSNTFASAVLGVILFFLIVTLVGIEIINGVKEEGYAKNAVEIIGAIAIVVIFWFVLKAVLHTNYPLDVVPSCSMLPVLQRGDMVVLQGITNITNIKAPIVSVSQTEFQSMMANIKSEYLSCAAYIQSNNRIYISQIVKPGYGVGLYNNSAPGGQIIPQNQQGNNLIQYTCGTKQIRYQNGTNATEAFTTAITISGTTVTWNKNNSVIVYQTIPPDRFYYLGDSYIVHRVYAIINASGSYYLLTKGDNNPGLDMQFNNYPVALNYAQGKVVASLPYIGYLKLILSNNFNQPAGCNSTVVQ